MPSDDGGPSLRPGFRLCIVHIERDVRHMGELSRFPEPCVVEPSLLESPILGTHRATGKKLVVGLSKAANSNDMGKAHIIVLSRRDGGWTRRYSDHEG